MFTNGQSEDEELTVEIGEGLLTYNGKPAKGVVNVNKAGNNDNADVNDGKSSNGKKTGNNIKTDGFGD